MVLGVLDEGAAVERDDAGHGGISLVGNLRQVTKGRRQPPLRGAS
jgi:hypothetical protein